MDPKIIVAGRVLCANLIDKPRIRSFMISSLCFTALTFSVAFDFSFFKLFNFAWNFRSAPVVQKFLSKLCASVRILREGDPFPRELWEAATALGHFFLRRFDETTLALSQCCM